MAAPFERLQHFLLIAGSGEELIEIIDTPFPVVFRQSRYIGQHAQNFLFVRCAEPAVHSLRYLSYRQRWIRIGISGIDQAGKIKIVWHVVAL